MKLAKTIGEGVTRARKSLQLTQADAADRVNVGVEFYGRIERGTSLPSMLTFVRISSALGVSADFLLGRETDTPLPAPRQPDDPPEIRRILARLRKATPTALRLVTMLLKELEPRT